ncbi:MULTISPECIES: peptidase inhibitor family I36 protein [Nocardia]|uniref:peptidase inhibitor family I36 protein n=1 Tax=Nocardia TaxID=1817 RepID=UPI002931444F|nr:peptidase inhibitor family I36 protein [Nocardia canadensis]
MQKLVAVVLAFVVGFGIVGCKADEGADTAKEVVCEMVVPVVEVVATKLKAGMTVTAALVVAATGIALSQACTYLLDRLGEAPDEEIPVILDNGKGTETTKVSANTFTSVTQNWCDKTGGCTGYDRCPTGYLCLFTGSEGTGKMSLFKIGSPDLAGQHIESAARSVYNRTGKTATLFAARDNTGESYTVAKSAQGDLPGDWQARARSLTVGPLPTASVSRTSPTTPTGPSTPKSSATTPSSTRSTSGSSTPTS